jgi:hypothetical protein
MDGEKVIPKNITPEERRIAWENLKAFIECDRRYYPDMKPSNSGAVVKSTAPTFSRGRS